MDGTEYTCLLAAADGITEFLAQNLVVSIVGGTVALVLLILLLYGIKANRSHPETVADGSLTTDD